MEFDNEIVLSQSILSGIDTKNAIEMITDLTNEIYTNEVIRSKSRLSANNFSLYSDSKGTFKRPKTVPVNIEATTDEDCVDAVKNDLISVNDNIKAKYERMYTPSKHGDVEQSKVSKYSCQICGPETCKLCDEQHQRKLLSNKINETKSLKSGHSGRNSMKPPQSSHYTVYTDSNETDNTMLLSILLKNKYNVQASENEIEEMIKSQNIFVYNRSSPYNLKRANSISRQTNTTFYTTMTLPNAAYENDEEIDIYQNDNNTADYNNNSYNPTSQMSARTANTTTRSMLTQFEEPLSTTSTIEATLQKLKKFKTSEYYFKNMKDLRAKSFRIKDKLLLTQTPVPTSTNKLFLNIERFDIADRYKEIKKRADIIMPKAYKLLKRPSIDSNIRVDNINKNETKNLTFRSMKNVENYEPEFKKFYEPPLLKLQMQKFDEIYDKLSPQKNFKVVHHKGKS